MAALLLNSYYQLKLKEGHVPLLLYPSHQGTKAKEGKPEMWNMCVTECWEAWDLIRCWVAHMCKIG